MDKEWVYLDRTSDEFISGLRAFINRALAVSPYAGKIKCPCRDCKNRWNTTATEVEAHLICVGMWPRYLNVPWVSHGEQLPLASDRHMAGPSNPLHVMPDNELAFLLQDAFGFQDDNHTPQMDAEQQPDVQPDAPNSCPTPDARKFYELLKDADTDLFPGARMKKLEFLVKLYQNKCLHRESDIHFSKTLELLKEAFPVGETLPSSFYKTKKMIKDLGLSYEKIHACPNDCMLYWKEHVNDASCHVCGISRWKENVAGNDTSGVKPKAAKILRYFPLGPRLQRLYMSRHTSESMSWHFIGRTKDGVLRHPADSPAWAKLDESFPEFGNEGRNVRLGLASDGFNPFGNLSSTYSTWPVVLSVYNLPPWLCMKQPYLFLSLLIPGPKEPGMDIDVYLQPLVEELKLLWNEGLKTYDAYKKETFTMRAAVLWTINDFPGYAKLSGYSTSGFKACPVCADKTQSLRLDKCWKQCFMGCRRWLPEDDKYCGWSQLFNGHPERETRPKRISGSECLRLVSALNYQPGKEGNKNVGRKRARQTGEEAPEPDFGNWRKKSIFFELLYWEHLLLRHNIDLMHTEKNVTENTLGTLLGTGGKNKDTVAGRLDMVTHNIKPALHPRLKVTKLGTLQVALV